MITLRLLLRKKGRKLFLEPPRERRVVVSTPYHRLLRGYKKGVLKIRHKDAKEESRTVHFLASAVNSKLINPSFFLLSSSSCFRFCSSSSRSVPPPRCETRSSQTPSPAPPAPSPGQDPPSHARSDRQGTTQTWTWNAR